MISSTAREDAGHFRLPMFSRSLCSHCWLALTASLLSGTSRVPFEHLKAQGVRLYDWYPNSLPKGMDVRSDYIPVRFVSSFTSEQTEVQRLESVLNGYFES